MTAIKDPYPENLVDLGDPVAPLVGFTSDDALIRAVNRLAQAVEQIALNQLERPAQNAPGPALAALPPVRPVQQPQAAAAGVCPIHGTPWKVVPAGISKKTGNAYDAFQACSTKGCDQRPPR